MAKAKEVSIVEELLEFTGQKAQKKSEDAQAFCTRLIEAVGEKDSEEDEAAFAELSEETQAWYNKAVGAYNKDKPLPLPPELETEEEEEEEEEEKPTKKGRKAKEEEEEEEEKPTKKGKSKSKDGDDSSPAISTLIRTITCKNFKLDEDQVVEKAKEILGKNMKEAAARLWYKRTRNVISTLQELGKL